MNTNKIKYWSLNQRDLHLWCDWLYVFLYFILVCHVYVFHLQFYYNVWYNLPFLITYLIIVISIKKRIPQPHMHAYCVVFFFVLCTLCCQLFSIVYLWLPLRYSLTYINMFACIWVDIVKWHVTVLVVCVIEVVAWVDIVKWGVTVLVVCVIEVVDSELAFCGIMVSWSCSISFRNEYQFQLIFIFKITEVFKSQSN